MSEGLEIVGSAVVDKGYPIPDTVEVSRDRLSAVLQALVTNLPDMLAEQSGSMPLPMRLALPGLRMFLTTPDVAASLSGDSLTNFVWEALLQCQNTAE